MLLLAILFGAPAAPAQDVTAASFEGRTIGRIEFDPPNQPLPSAELERLLPFHAGALLKLDDVRTAIEKLYRTGRFADISVDAQPESGGAADHGPIVLRISTELSYFVGSVIFDGVADPPNRGQLATATKLELGTPFEPDVLDQAVHAMQERFRANGLYQANVKYEVERDASTGDANVHFQIDAGNRARFDGVKVSGQLTQPLDSLIRSTRWRRGFGPFLLPGWRESTENRVLNGLDRVRKDFQNKDRLQARVTLGQLEYHDTTNTVTPTLLIDSGPILEVDALGAKVSKGRLRQLIPIFQERSVDRSLLLEGQRNLTEYFQSIGYFDAQVDFQDQGQGQGVQVVDYSIQRNGRYKLARIEIAGNHIFSENTIRERIGLTPASFPRYRFGRYSQKLRDQDQATLLDLYHSNGFRDADVKVSTIEKYHGHPDQIAVRFEIAEGPRRLVHQLEFEGISVEDAKYLRTLLQSIEGEPYSETGVAADRDTILSYYYNHGYPDATFDWTESPGPEPNRVNLRYTIQPGERQFVRRVLVRGLHRTNPSLVSNRILLASGDPISQSRIVESQQKLNDLGIFSSVQTAIQNPSGDEESKYVLFQIDEANRYSFNAGVGAQLARIGGGVTSLDAPAGQYGFSPRLTLGVSRLNLLGLAHTLSLQTLVSTIEQRAVLTYTAAQFTGNQNLTLTFSGLFDNSYDVRTFSARRVEGTVQLAQRLSRTRSLQYRFTMRRVTVDSLKISPELIPLLSQPDRVGQLSMSFIQDRRDDPTDSHRGSYNTIDVGVALPGASETQYARMLMRNSTYYRLGRDVVLARTLQFGFIDRLGGSPAIPLAERFFSGGASSQRAFPDNQAGPRDLETGFPLGGNALLFHQTELRFPLFGDNIGGVLFHDMGNVYDDVRDINFRFRQHNLADFNYMVQAAGIGIRYRTPIGPLRIDFSFSPDPPRFFGYTGTLQQLLANQGVLNNQRISIFQFHFSLGQTF